MAIVVQQAGVIVPATVYPQLVADVYTLTARPDLVAETALAIRNATMKAHLADFWKGDVTIVPQYILPAPVTNPIQPSSRYTINLADVVNFPLLRKVAYIKEYINPTGASPNAAVSGWDALLSYGSYTQQQANYEECSPEMVIDDYRVERTNYWYQAGKQVMLRTFFPIQAVVIGYYANPNITPASYNSWIAADFPDLIVSEAAATVFRMIGKLDEAAAYAGMWQQNLHYVTMSQVTAATYR